MRLMAFLFTLLLPGTVMAQAFVGPYVGGYGAYSMYQTDTTVLGLGSDESDADGFGFGGFVGFGLRNQALYGGLEAEVGYDGAEGSVSVLGTPVSAEAQLTYGIAFRGGWVIQERYLPYVRIGWQRTDFEASVPGFGSDSESLNAFRLGLGAEMLATDRFSVRAEYSYNIYEDFEDPPVSVETDQHQFRIGAALHF